MALRFVKENEPRILFGITIIAVAFSVYNSFGLKNWILEALPVLIALPLISFFYFKKFRFTPLLYRLLFLGGLMLLVGAHYSYARVPWGSWIQKTLGLKRNHYDRIGHFFQGFVPAILAREVLLRKRVVKHGFWLSFIVICVCLAFSAYYELLEWFAVVSGADDTGDFMGSQGDRYDAQWDMFLAFLGSCISLVFLSELHDFQLSRLGCVKKQY